MSGEYESYQGRHVNKLMAIWLWLKIIITIIIKKEFVVCINCSCLVTKSHFWYWDTNKKNGLSEEMPKAQYRSLWQWDIACDEKTLLQQPSISAK